MTAFPSEVNFSFIYFYFFLQMRDPFQLQKLVKQCPRIVPSSANSAISSTLRPPLHPLPVSPPPHHHHRSAETEQAAAGATPVFPPLCAVKQERAPPPPPPSCVSMPFFSPGYTLTSQQSPPLQSCVSAVRFMAAVTAWAEAFIAFRYQPAPGTRAIPAGEIL